MRSLPFFVDSLVVTVTSALVAPTGKPARGMPDMPDRCDRREWAVPMGTRIMRTLLEPNTEPLSFVSRSLLYLLDLEIRAQYRKLQKTFHPDVMSAELSADEV